MADAPIQMDWKRLRFKGPFTEIRYCVTSYWMKWLKINHAKTSIIALGNSSPNSISNVCPRPITAVRVFSFFKFYFLSFLFFSGPAPKFHFFFFVIWFDLFCFVLFCSLSAKCTLKPEGLHFLSDGCESVVIFAFTQCYLIGDAVSAGVSSCLFNVIPAII